jgi:BlaI family penicillinase repressor
MAFGIFGEAATLKSKRTQLGAVQLRIMQALWERGEATARDITDALSRERAIAHSTVQTLLRQLEAKGAVDHKVEGRTFVYRALIPEAEVTSGAARELVGRLFDGSAAGLVAHLVRHEKLSRSELRQIGELIQRKEREL